MESDSDSDGSHISSTPPRHPFPSLPEPKTKPQPEPKPEPKRKQPPKPTSTLTKTTKLKPSKSPQKPTNTQTLPPNSTPTPCFSLPIKRSIPQNPNLFESGSGSVRAGSFLLSKAGSFSKFHSLGVRNENVSILTSGSSSKFDFDKVCDDGVECGPGLSSALGSVRAGSFSKFNSLGVKVDKDSILTSGSCSKFDVDEVCDDGVGVGVVKKRAVKKPSNLIGCGSGSGSGLGSGVVPMKRFKCSSEGNFVKLNINGHCRRFSFKGKKKGFSSSSRRSYRRWGKKIRGKNGVEGNGGNDEDVSGFECSGKHGNEEEKMSKEEVELLRNVVLDVRNECSDENLVKLLKITHGYDSFREGQLEAIKMVLGGKSTMVVLPTGTGKSLCYQLPAIVFPGVTLVVSPLVALMIDQLKQLPSVVNGALLSSSQSLEEMSETLSLLREGSIKVLFVSPERFLNAEFMSIISSCSLISLVVIDEAHCVSEWSHNFRPSYMRLRASLLRDKLNVKCILAMTATATTKTLGAVMLALDIPSTNLVQTVPLRNNLQLSVSSSGSNKMKDLITLIKSPLYSEVKSIIIYCKFQSDTETISKYLCDCSVPAMSYHSGMLAKDRSRVQKLFCSNKIRVVVATVAFGMGLDKSDVGAVIHYSLPESLEEYVQEIGRSGRDGRLSYCHLYLDDAIYYKLRSYAYSDGVDEYAVNKLLSQVFGHEMKRKGEIYSLVRESASHRFDIKDEVILTILTQLELGETQYLCLLPQMNVTCSLYFHRTPPLELAAKDLVVAGILNSSESKHGTHVFDIPSVANAVGLTAVDLLNHLQTLKAKGEITYDLKDPAYCYVIVNAPRDLCSLAAQITKWLSEIECCKVMKLDTMFHAAVFAMTSCERLNGCDSAQHTTCLQKRISEYFSDEHHIDPPTKMHKNSPFLRADIKVFLQSNSGAKFTPRAVARVLHGIASPAYPSATWSKTHFWGRYAHVDFKVVMDAAKAELMNFVGKDAS